MGADNHLRISELARSAGITAQQIRNYVNGGLLPTVERTEAGYRIFTSAHAEALRTARLVAAGHGWHTAGVVMRAVHNGDLERVLATIDASHAELDRQRKELAEVVAAVDTLVAGRGGQPARSPRPRLIGAVARIAGVRPPVLRQWEERGLVRPQRDRATGYRLYPDFEVRAAQVVAHLRRGHYPFEIICAVLAEMRATGNPERVRAELAKRADALHDLSVRRLRATAAVHAYLAVRQLAGQRPAEVS